MSGLETAIRNALERSDRSNAETRARIYQSARQALENGLQKQQIEDPEIIAKQRHRLEAIIHAIETEERAALKARTTAPPVVSFGEGRPGQVKAGGGAAGVEPPTRREPAFEGARPAAQADAGLQALRADRDGPMVSTRPAAEETRQAAGAHSTPAASDLGVTDKRPRKRRRGRLLSFLMVFTTLAAAAGAAVWWVQTNDLLRPPADTNVANPPPSVETEDFSGAALPTLGEQEGFSSDWIEIFTAAEAAAVRPAARARAEPVDDDGGARVRLTSMTVTEDGDVAIEIPADVLSELSGKSSTLALSVKALPGKATEFAVECDFSTLGACGRHRFTVHDERLEMLFKVSFDRSLAPNSPGRLLINSDVSGGGNSLEVYAIRVLPGQ
ncbi:biotin transporter BioY [Ensifer sp. NBAIM29]|nr:biotin transporter BioY [Ensifer sp. NBAIM29]